MISAKAEVNQGIKTSNWQLEFYLRKKICISYYKQWCTESHIYTHNKTNYACSAPGLTFPKIFAFVNMQA